jgi:SPP1 family predicted phage head-tail adaptor
MASNLNKLVSIQHRTEQQEPDGQPREAWHERGKAWASIRPVAGREYYSQVGPRAEVTHEIILRHGITVKPQDRVEYYGRTFDVLSVFNVEELNRYLKLMAKENAAE